MPSCGSGSRTPPPVSRRGRPIRCGIAEVPIRFEERTLGASKMSLKVQLESALMPWKLLLGRAL
jgi:hypothetical protein